MTADVQREAWRTVACPRCGTIAGLACVDEHDYRQPDQTHSERIEAFYDFTEYRGQ